MDYVFSVRKTRGGKFGNEPGATYFLEVPEGASDISPGHKSASKNTWVKKVMAQAATGTNEVSGNVQGDIVIYVHGFNTPTATMLERHRLIRKGLEKQGFGGVVVSFDWPSASSALNYLEDRTDAKETARRLVEEGITTFAALQTTDCEINLHLMAHSMGAYVVREAFDDADDRASVAAKSWSVSQVILMSADISASSLAAGNPKSSSLYRHCVRLTNYYNPFDSVLSLSGIKRIGVAPRVGRIGLPDNRPNKAVNVNCGTYYHDNRDAFKGLKFGDHIWYFYDEIFMRDAYATICGNVDRNLIATRQGAEGQLNLTG